MSGPLLFFAEHMLLVLTMGLLLGLTLVGAAVRSLRRPAVAPATRRRRWLAGGMAVIGTALAAVAIVVLAQLGPTLITQGLLIGRPAPPFEVSHLEDGRKVSLTDLKGQVVLINFWATWCPPCREEMPALESLHVELNNRGLVVLNVSDEDSATIKRYLETEPMSTLHARAEPLPWPELGRPTSFVIDRSGVIRRIIQGPRTRQQFLELVSPWL